MADVAKLAQAFQRFAERECGSSPLYRRLTEGTTQDGDLLALAAHGEAGPKPNMLLASVHCLLLGGDAHPLRDFYPTVTGVPAPPGDPFPLFREFCLSRAGEIRRLLETRLVQTNEVARAAFLWPAFAAIAARFPDRPLGLVEVGSSAGLLLLWNRYGYDYGSLRRGDPGSPVQIHTELRGDRTPPLPEAPPAVAAALGVDLHPVDLTDPAEQRWLRALVWGDQPDRMARLVAAMRVGREHPPRLIAGDALLCLPDVLSALPEAVLPVVFHSHTLNQFSAEDRERFCRLLAAASAGRPVCHLALEALVRGDGPRMDLEVYRDGRRAEESLLARFHSHGEWLQWELD